MLAGRGEVWAREGWGAKGRSWSWAVCIWPPFPHSRRTVEAWRIGLFRSLTGIGSRRKERRKTPQNFLKVIQVGPTGREFDNHAACGFTHPRGDFDQPRAPRAGLTLAERIALAAAVVPIAALLAGKRFDGNGLRDGFRRRIGDDAAHADQEVVRRRVQIEAEEIGEVAVIAETVGPLPVVKVASFVATFQYVVSAGSAPKT